jgi:sorting nexin-8
MLMIAVDLPVPQLPSLTSTTTPVSRDFAAKPPQRPETPPSFPTAVPISAQKQRAMQRDSLDFPEADPWGSPVMHRGHDHEGSSPQTNGTSRGSSSGVQEPARTTSNFTTAPNEASNGTSNQSDESNAPTTGVWGSYDRNQSSSTSFNNPMNSTFEGDGFGSSGVSAGQEPGANIPSRSFGGGRVTGGGVQENIVITLLPEKEGMFMFQHHNYQVTSTRRGSKVVRRYSDFVWLLDCLHKRYPFRQLPLLPPKRVGGMFSFF